MTYILDNLNQVILNSNGIGVSLDVNKPATIKSALIFALEMSPSVPGKNVQKLGIGLKLVEAKDSIELDKESFDLLKDSINKIIQFPTIIIGNLEKYFSECVSK